MRSISYLLNVRISRPRLLVWDTNVDYRIRNQQISLNSPGTAPSPAVDENHSRGAFSACAWPTSVKTCTVEPVKLNTCVHWTPAYIEQFFMSRHSPIENQWEATWIHWTPVFLEHWTPNLFPQATFNLSTLNIQHWFETFHVSLITLDFVSISPELQLLRTWKHWTPAYIEHFFISRECSM